MHLSDAKKILKCLKYVYILLIYNYIYLVCHRLNNERYILIQLFLDILSYKDDPSKLGGIPIIDTNKTAIGLLSR